MVDKISNMFYNGSGLQNNKDMKEMDQSKYKLNERQFQIRKSLFTEIFEEHVIGKAIYNFFTAYFLYSLVTSLMRDYTTERKTGVFQFLYGSFVNFDKAFLIWLGYNAVTFLSYFCFKLWAEVRRNLKTHYKKFWDNLWMIILLGYYLSYLYITNRIISVCQMSGATNIMFTMEAVRFLMKIHAFVRSNVPKVLRVKTHENREMNLPKFSKFLYFLYAPTCVYRDEYPRTDRIRWRFVLFRTLELAALIFFIALHYVDTLHPMFQDFCTRKFRYSEIIVLVLQTGVPCGLIIWAFCFIIIHSIQNIFGELLRFGDRLFYGDYWSSRNYREFFRKWNFVVGDWLYTYVYKDMYESIIPGNEVCAKLATFILSSVFHEWQITTLTGYVLPVCSLLFMSGALISIFLPASKHSFFNIIYFFNHFLGAGQLFSYIVMENFARENLRQDSYGLFPVIFSNCTT